MTVQRSVDASRCVSCDLVLERAAPQRTCPRCGGALLALPEEVTRRGPLARLWAMLRRR